MVSTSAWAWPIATPGLSRPITRHCTLLRLATSYGMRPAIQTLGNCSIFAFGGNSNSKPGANTPAIVGGGPNAAETGRVLPIIDRSPPKRCWKYSLLRITIVGSGGGALAAGALPSAAAGG